MAHLWPRTHKNREKRKGPSQVRFGTLCELNSEIYRGPGSAQKLTNEGSFGDVRFSPQSGNRGEKSPVSSDKGNYRK